MKKITLILFIIFPIINIIAQNKDIYGSVYYKFTPNNNEITKRNNAKKNVKDMYKGLYEFIADVKFKLEFVNKKSIFSVKDELDNGLKPKGASIASKLISNGSYYCDLNEDIQLRKVDGEILVETQPSNIKWILTQETKKINNYLCYKAISSVTNKNSTGVYTFEIIAWYTPEISVASGPKQFVGLPGLVLELKDTHYTFFATKIVLFPKEKPIIKPFKGKIITEEKYQERIREMMGGFIKR